MTDDIGLYVCPVCGSPTISAPGEYEICSTCDWEDDPVQRNNPDLRGGANKNSLHEARLEWETKQGRGDHFSK
jgi:hypothetical protein